MKYQLINTPNNIYNAQSQILINRGIKENEIQHYMNLTNKDLNEPEIFGEKLLQDAAAALRDTMNANEDICIVVDCDCDGYTSSAILINYLYDCNADFTKEHVHWFLHDGKQHGLADAMNWIQDIYPDLVIVPDAGSNDIEYLQQLEDNNIDVIIFDHHEIEGKKKNEVLQITPLDFWKQNHPHLYLINSQI